MSTPELSHGLNNLIENAADFGEQARADETLSMIAGASGSAIAAMALAFTFSAARDQDDKLMEQRELMQKQLEVLERIDADLQKVNGTLQRLVEGPSIPSD